MTSRKRAWQEQHFDLQFAFSKLSGANRHGHRQAAANQDSGIKRPDYKIQTAAGDCELREIPALR